MQLHCLAQSTTLEDKRWEKYILLSQWAFNLGFVSSLTSQFNEQTTPNVSFFMFESDLVKESKFEV